MRIEDGLHEPPGVEVSHANLLKTGQLADAIKFVGSGNLRDRMTLEHNVEEGDQVHRDEDCHARIKTPDEVSHMSRDPHKHESNAALDQDDRDAVEDFEEEEPLCSISLGRSRLKGERISPSVPLSLGHRSEHLYAHRCH